MTNLNSKRETASSLLKNDFCKFCHLLYERHLVSGVGGNIALRNGGSIYVTPSGYSLRDIGTELLVTLDEHGDVTQGGIPSKDVGMHLGILRSRSDINVVCHIHGAEIVATSTILNPGPVSIPPLTPGFVYFSHPLTMLPFMLPGSKEMTEKIVASLTVAKSVLLKNHGLVTIGKDFKEALNIAEEINEAARIFLLTEGKASVIPAEYLDKIC